MKINNEFIWYFVTDENLMQENEYRSVIEKVINLGFKYIQLRFKKTPKAKILKIAKDVKKITEKYQAKLIINDYLDIAQEINADGIHIGQSDIKITEIKKTFKNKIIGISCTNLKEALIAKHNGASYIGIGAIYPTDTKKDAKIIGIKTLKEIIDNVDICTIAIGGINKNNISDIIKTKVNGIALISAVLINNNIENNIKELKSKYKKIAN